MKKEQIRSINTFEYNRIVQSIPFHNKIANYLKENFIGKKVVYRTQKSLHQQH